MLYGGNNNWFAAYAYWLLKLRGFDQVKLLNGGRKKWELESRELVTDAPAPRALRPRVHGGGASGDPCLRDEVLAKVGASGFVDVRSPEEFRGEKLAPDHLPQEQAQVPGHIAGAANIPWVEGRQRRRHLQDRRRAAGALRGAKGITGDQRGHRVLPDRRAVVAHLVRAAGAARLRERQELRRLVDRVRLARRRTRRARLIVRTADSARASPLRTMRELGPTGRVGSRSPGGNR